MFRLITVGVAAFALSGCVVVHSSPEHFVPVAASEKINVDSFDSVSIKGGGNFEIRYGTKHSFENTGSKQAWKVRVVGDALKIECEKPCRGKDHAAVITMPYIENFALTGGGDVDFTGTFNETDEFNLSLVGGGDIDASAVRAKDVNVSIVGGGDIEVSASDELSISLVGGGAITYHGNPHISKSIIGGGSVEQAR